MAAKRVQGTKADSLQPAHKPTLACTAAYGRKWAESEFQLSELRGQILPFEKDIAKARPSQQEILIKVGS